MTFKKRISMTDQYIVYYPLGQTLQLDGTFKNNTLVAVDIIAALLKGESVAIPNAGWRISKKVSEEFVEIFSPLKEGICMETQDYGDSE